mmetsp:Transcript_6079/g.8101  ORF Transcript_6079/g.8101 Transcript_6079/m.8101 type:complete len:82 (-) Transcript_6079:162-407(-)
MKSQVDSKMGICEKEQALMHEVDVESDRRLQEKQSNKAPFRGISEIDKRQCDSAKFTYYAAQYMNTCLFQEFEKKDDKTNS